MLSFCLEALNSNSSQISLLVSILLFIVCNTFQFFHFDLFVIFLHVRGGGRGSGFNKGRGGGGLSEEEAREGEGRLGNVCGEGAGGLIFFFFGAEMPTKVNSEGQDENFRARF